ncbi:hypothetical protein L2Y94_16005 [Luteibacter aegosomatis]|uniref:hypothetical protein n=1 Tax=Luteibacter aegosomatis TaxID=2911537 RepID=UPI001FFB38EE|nr:hypothetical protein [Luteibacter aegosomatis]UPG84809.1 hypothetical protein L2Y94_16005 [Luteibacter aegosomatis]
MAALLAILTAVTVAIYLPGLGGGFVFDDYPNIVDNPMVQPAHATLAELTSAALSSPASELKRPLASLSFAANFLATGLDASAMKATNIGLHVLNGWLVFFLCRRLLRVVRPGERSLTRDVTASAIALAWLVAPINLTAVLYVVQRMESIANLFVIAGLIGYLKIRIRPGFGVHATLLCATWLIACTGVGLLAKETAVLLPLYALCVEAVIFRFGANQPGMRRRIGIMYTLILGLPFVTGTAWMLPRLLDPAAWATRNFTLATRLLSEPRVILDYLAWTIVPTPSALSFYHDDFEASTSLFQPWTTLASMFGLALLCLGAWRIRRAAPLGSLGILWFLACQTLTGTILPIELVYEHRNYFASVGVALALAETFRWTAVSKDSTRLRLVTMLSAAGLFAWSMAVTFATSNAWGDPLSLAEELGRRGLNSHRAQYELGRAYIIASRYEASSPYIAKAIPPLEAAAAMPGASVLAEQALIFVHARAGLPVRDTWWASMDTKLHARPATVQDESSLGALAQCLRQGACHFEAGNLRDAFDAAMDQPNPSARLCAMYSDFAASSLHDETLALRLSKAAVEKAPGEPVYRISLARRALNAHDSELAREQIEALRRVNFAGRLDADIASLERDAQSTKRAGYP